MKVRIALMLLAGLVLAPAAVFAQYPEKPVRILVPNAPGAPTDSLARALAAKLQPRWKQSVVVENLPGANGIIAAERLAKSAPDGYTLMVTPAGLMSFHPALYDKLPYDPIRDFEPITLIADPGIWIVAHPGLAARSIKELVALSKAQPGKLSYGTIGGSIGFPYISSVLLKQTAGADLTFVNYRTGNQAITDLLDGRIQVMFDTVPSSLAHVRQGRLRALAFLGDKRHFAIPDVPTIAEAGFPEVTGGGWNGLVTRRGTPQAIVQKIYADAAAGLREPDIAKKLTGVGLQIVLSRPEEFDAFVRKELARWSKVIRENGIRAE